MRIAIFGGGSIGSRHAGNARALGHNVATYDVDPDRGITLDGFRAGEAEAVMICTPAHAHESMAEWLREREYAGPLLVEKPLALHSAAPIFRTWPHPVTMVGYNWRFHPQVRAWRARLPNRRDSVVLTCHTDMTLWPGRQYNDPLLECSHEIDIALWLGALPLVSRAGYMNDQPGFELTLGNAFCVQLFWDSAINERRFWVYRACTAFKVGGNCVNCGGHEFLHLTLADSVLLDESYRRELAHFLDCVKRGAPTETPFDQGLRVVEICERAKELAS